jgi:hypothetical protein
VKTTADHGEFRWSRTPIPPPFAYCGACFFETPDRMNRTAHFFAPLLSVKLV